MGDGDAFDVFLHGLKDVGGNATGQGVRINNAAKDVSKAAGAAQDACDSDAVSEALKGFALHVIGEERRTTGRVASGVTGLGEAAGAYSDADDEMARQGRGAQGESVRPGEGVFGIPGVERKGGGSEGGSLKDLLAPPTTGDEAQGSGG